MTSHQAEAFLEASRKGMSMETDKRGKEPTEEQREELGKCKSLREYISLCRSLGLALPDELLEGISGGKSENETRVDEMEALAVPCPVCKVRHALPCNPRDLSQGWFCFNCGSVEVLGS